MFKIFLFFFLLIVSCDKKESILPIEGCINSSACNFNPFAEIDDGSCLYPLECNLCDQCDVDAGSIYLSQDGELWYHIEPDIYGFQFDIYGVTITGIENGNAQTAGLIIDYSNGEDFSRVIGYSFDGNKIIDNCESLISISYNGNMQEIRNIIFGTTYGEQVSVNYQECN